ncbi:MAG TPA: hypothetical protein DD791_11515, partial [Syntrophomonas sp.]|nr:hypothetical protein [Syntrophomonas sp.]
QACAFYFNGVVDDKKLNEHVLKPLMMHSGGWESGDFNNTDRVDLIVRTSISVGQLRKTDMLIRKLIA